MATGLPLGLPAARLYGRVSWEVGGGAGVLCGRGGEVAWIGVGGRGPSLRTAGTLVFFAFSASSFSFFSNLSFSFCFSLSFCSLLSFLSRSFLSFLSCSSRSFLSFLSCSFFSFLALSFLLRASASSLALADLRSPSSWSWVRLLSSKVRMSTSGNGYSGREDPLAGVEEPCGGRVSSRASS